MIHSDRKPIVLTVDDDPIILSLILNVLKADHNVIPFSSGEEALRYLEGHSADLMLLDCKMPGMSGFDVLEILRSDEKLKDIPVIFLTGSLDDGDEIKALDKGAIDYIHKPIKPESLLKRVALQLELMAHKTHLESLVAEKTEQLAQSNLRLAQREKLTMELLAKASDIRDHETGEHISRTMSYIEIILKDLIDNPRSGYEMTEDRAMDIVEASQLHDIGKLAMPDKVLRKPGKLTPEEFEIIKQHPAAGKAILEEAVKKTPDDERLKEALNIAYGHHEKWDGSGYPLGLKGEDIPLSARIAAIADVFDALTSERPYKKAFPTDKALDIIYGDAGVHFDPYLIGVVRRHEAQFIAVKESGDERPEA